MLKLLANFLAFVGVIVASASDAQAGKAVEISYGALERQKLDIYAPEHVTAAPVMIFVHGGGWHIGKKERVHQKPRAFNREGFIFVSVGYPLLPDHPVETQAASVAEAIAWVSKNIADYGGDPAQLHLMGHSAGAHLVSLAALDQRYFASRQVSASSIVTVTSLDGASLNIPWRMENLEEAGRYARRMFRQSFGDDPVRWQALSPYHYIKEGQSIPAFLFVIAEARTASNLAADDVKKRMDEVGAISEIVEITNSNHLSINRKMGRKRDKAFPAIIDFIRKNAR